VDRQPDFRVKSRPIMSKAAKLDKLMEKRRFNDDFNQQQQGPKVQTIDFNLNSDQVNGVFELDEDASYPSDEDEM
jgi:hypothetical protein